MSLLQAISNRRNDSGRVADELNALVPALLSRFNSDVGPKLLSRLPSEALPETPRAASSFRSRVSLLVEYSLIEMLGAFLRDEDNGMNVTFNVTNEFADLFLRDENWNIELRIDVKTVHDLSAEASARYTVPASAVAPHDDYLLYAAWQWREKDWGVNKVIFPSIIDALFIPAIEVIKERDARQLLANGSFAADGTPLAASGRRDSNFGKFNRLVHPSRRDASLLEPRIRRLLDLLENQTAARAEVPESMSRLEALAEADAPVTASTDEL